MSTTEQYVELRNNWRKRVIKGLYVVAFVFFLIEALTFVIMLMAGHSFSTVNIVGRLLGLWNSTNKAIVVLAYVLVFIIIPSSINFFFVMIADMVNKSEKCSENKCNTYLIFAAMIQCIVASTWHSYFPIATATFVAPVFLACMTDDSSVFRRTSVKAFILMVLSIFIAPVFDSTWSFTQRLINLLLCSVFFFFTLVICMEIERFSRKKNEIIAKGTNEEHRMQLEAMHDSMTGLFNHAEFENYLNNYIDTNLSIAVLDIDHFKDVNDNFGHKNGDEVLVRVAQVLEEFVGNKGRVFRYGGEEFAVVFPFLTKEEASKMLEKARISINVQYFSFMKNKAVSISGGVVDKPSGHVEPKELFERADQALYEAKESGRNRLVIK